MRKFVVAFGTLVFVSVVTALPAFADSSLPGPVVQGVQGGSGTSGTAFTGAANLGPAMVAFVVLVVLGFSALALQRRRTHSAA